MEITINMLKVGDKVLGNAESGGDVYIVCQCPECGEKYYRFKYTYDDMYKKLPVARDIEEKLSCKCSIL